ncbi:uncharacterized protein LOC108708933 isoform X1 [Xenopus laevis]|uniref:Uncharacterized protein LOC108708933 isoform X1 n=1 Tax=Xenopus laevis TaxID=8355 RepID=A0A8J1MG26_XENLA|nr:uncharacterized protein LOC108708933 isoform X1 [Xenopus laevis]
MAENHNRQMGSANNQRRIPNRIFSQATRKVYSLASKRQNISNSGKRLYSYGRFGRGKPFRAKEGDIFHNVPGTQDQRQSKTGYRFKVPEQIYRKEEVPNGDYKVSPKFAQQKRSDGNYRSKGCLSACANSCGKQKISESGGIPGWESQAFSVQGITLRHNISTKGIYKNHRGVGSGLEEGGYLRHTLSRRLVVKGVQRQRNGKKSTKNSRDSRSTWLAVEQRKIKFAAINFSKILGFSHQYQEHEDYSATRKVEQDCSRDKVDDQEQESDNSQSDETPWAVHSSNRGSSMGKSPNENLASKNFGNMEPKGVRFTKNHESDGETEKVVTVVVSTTQSEKGEVISSNRTSCDNDRCIPPGLGGTSEKTYCSRAMVCEDEVSIIKLQRAESSMEGAESLQEQNLFQKCPDSVGQHIGGGIHQSPRWNEIKETGKIVCQDHVLGSEQVITYHGDPHKRSGQSVGGPTQQAEESAGRVVFESEDLPRGSQTMGTTSDRFDGHQNESQVQEILFYLPQGQTDISGCFLHDLEISSSICISSSTHDPESNQEGEAGSSKGNSHYTELAQEIMVPRTLTSIQGQVLESTTEERFDNSEGDGISGLEKTKIDSMDVERTALVDQGLSKEVVETLLQSRKKSTSSAYERIWKVYDRWCSQKGFSSLQKGIAQILQFLQDGFDKGLQPNTLRVQVSALSAHLNTRLSLEPMVRRFLTATKRLRPRVKSFVSPWDLDFVLNRLCKPPFEPLQEIPLKMLTLKTVFLTAITSARRIGEIQALGASDPYIVFFSDKVCLRTLPFFIPKVPTSWCTDEVINLPIFFPEPKDDAERLLHSLDLKRCLMMYLERTKQLRKSDHLFILFSGKNKGNKASKASIARWLKETITTVYVLENREPPKVTKAHSTRGIATSWAERACASPQDICKAATWSSLHTFVKHYRLDILSARDTAFGSKEELEFNPWCAALRTNGKENSTATVGIQLPI